MNYMNRIKTTDIARAYRARPFSGPRILLSYLSVFLGAIAALSLSFGASAVQAIETPTTTGGLIRNAPYIAHVRVRSSGPVPGVAATEYQLEVLEALKGRLPGTIRLRMFSGLRVVNPSGQRHPAGSEWLVFLGPGNSGLYPLRSLQWGRLDLAIDPDSDLRIITRELAGVAAPTASRYHTLREFREIVRSLLGGQEARK